jgi:hypothetical protein
MEIVVPPAMERTDQALSVLTFAERAINTLTTSIDALSSEVNVQCLDSEPALLDKKLRPLLPT